MKTTALNSLKYTGIVTLYRYAGEKKIKIAEIQNTGGDSLFNFLAECLVGDFDTASISRPTKIMLLEEIDDEKDSRGEPVPAYLVSKSGFIYLLSKPEKTYDNTNKKCTVCFSFKIPRDMLESANTSSLCIGLYANNTNILDIDNWAALVKNIPINGSQILASSSYLLDWQLNITNTSNASSN
jgi:hypothetical protein